MIGAKHAGFDSFPEVRRGFKFHDNRPNFYRPPGVTSHSQHSRHKSVFSIASVSSYGQVINNRLTDPFNYGAIAPLPSLRECPSSDDFSFSMSSIDDTFSFIHRQPRRRRIDSDASSYYFRASVHSQMHPYNRVSSHRLHSSSASVALLCPPISLYNRSYAHHRHNDSTTSISSVAQSYTHGAGTLPGLDAALTRSVPCSATSRVLIWGGRGWETRCLTLHWIMGCRLPPFPCCHLTVLLGANSSGMIGTRIALHMIPSWARTLSPSECPTWKTLSLRRLGTGHLFPRQSLRSSAWTPRMHHLNLDRYRTSVLLVVEIVKKLQNHINPYIFSVPVAFTILYSLHELPLVDGDTHGKYSGCLS